MGLVTRSDVVEPPASFGFSNPNPYTFGTLLTDPTPVSSAQAWKTYSPASTSSMGGTSDVVSSTLTRGGAILGVIGGINAAIGSYFAASSQSNALKMQAQNARFASQMANLNARHAEFVAESAMHAGEQTYARYTMGAGQARSSAATSLAARGIAGGVGTSAEILGSMDVIRELDKLNIDANKVRQAEAYRMQAINYQNQSAMDAATASNLQATAGTINAPIAAFSSLLGSASEMGAAWLRTKRFEELLGGVSTRRF